MIIRADSANLIVGLSMKFPGRKPTVKTLYKKEGLMTIQIVDGHQGKNL